MTTPGMGAGPRPMRHGAATQSQLWACYSFIPFMLLFFAGWVAIGHLLPPLAPSMPPAEVAAYFAEHRDRLRLCMILCMFSTAFLLVFQAALIAQIGRIERGRPKVWTYAALMAGAGNVVSFTFPLMFWTAALFRAERPPEILALANDMAWLPFLGMVSPFIPLPFCVAIAGLSDDAADPVFPRWFCYYTLASALAFLPAALIVFFQHGWFAWNGMFGWWLPFGDTFTWMLITFFLLRRGILAQADSSAGVPEGGRA